MSTTIQPTARATEHPPLCESNVTLLNALYARCRPGTHGRCIIGRGQASTEYRILAGELRDHLDPRLMGELEYRVADDLTLTAATFFASADLRDLGSLHAEIPLPPRFEKYGGWVIPEEVERAAWTRLDGFAVPPSIVIHQGWSLLILWPLEQPLRLDDNHERERANRVQEALAIALGGSTDDVQVVVPSNAVGPGTRYKSVPAWTPERPVVRLPGSRNHDRGEAVPVSFVRLSEQLHSIEDVERALQLKRSRAKKETK